MAKTQKKGAKKKSSTAKKNAAKRTENAAKAAKQKAAGRQMNAIILFAVSLFLLFVTLIPGGNVWAHMQNFIFGLFGIGAFILPFILIYVAVMTSMDKDGTDIKTKIIQSSVLVVLFCSAVCIFASAGPPANYFESLKDAYDLGRATNNGGVLGAFIGGALLMLFDSKVPAAITIVILIFVFFMIISGTTLVNLFGSIANPVKKAGKATEQNFQEKAVDKARLNEGRKMVMEAYNRNPELVTRKLFDVDVDLGPGPADGSHLDDEITKFEQELTQGIVEEESPVKFNASAPEIPENIYAFYMDDDALPEEPPKKRKKAVKKTEPVEKPEVKPEPVQPPTPAPSVRLDDLVKKAADKTAGEKTEETDDSEFLISPDAMRKRDEKGEYRLPPYDCLNVGTPGNTKVSETELRENAEKLVAVLKSFGVKTSIVDISKGPSVTRYELSPAPGVKISKITNLADDIALNMAASGVRIEAPIPGKAAVGIEVPNRTRDMVSLREVISSAPYRKASQKKRLTVALGRDIAGQISTTNIDEMPHLLVAGTTGSGKSVCLNSMILSILYNATPDEVRLIMIDPKKVEFSIYNGIPHLLVPVVSDPNKAAGALAWAVKEMLSRYKMFSENNVRDITGYNEMAKDKEEKDPIPEIVIFIDELADLMMATPTEVEDSICRIAQMGRAAGIHLVIATQRPSVDVITGLIKANIPSRLSLSVSSAVDSRTILDASGAEKLLGHGDMLFNPIGKNKPVRIQGCFTSDAEVENVVDFIKEENNSDYDEEVVEAMEKQAAAAEEAEKPVGNPNLDENDADVLVPEAIQVVVEAGQASTTMLQRKLRVGYARAARIIDDLEDRGVIGPFQGSKPREVLITKQQWLEMNAMSSGEKEDDGTAAAIELGLDNK